MTLLMQRHSKLSVSPVLRS